MGEDIQALLRQLFCRLLQNFDRDLDLSMLRTVEALLVDAVAPLQLLDFQGLTLGSWHVEVSV